MGLIQSICLLLRAFLSPRLSLAAENLALRQQLATYHHSRPRPKLRQRDRLFWVVLSRLWPGWQAALLIVQPATVVHWHRQGFQLFWRWKSRGGKAGRPRIEREIRDLIRRMSRENTVWGAPRIQAELKLLGYAVAESTVVPPENTIRPAAWFGRTYVAVDRVATSRSVAGSERETVAGEPLM